jgi:hypothetical protein
MCFLFPLYVFNWDYHNIPLYKDYKKIIKDNKNKTQDL